MTVQTDAGLSSDVSQYRNGDWLWYRHPDPPELSADLLREIAGEGKP